uniref:S-layer domain protein n=1 Tax=Cyanothece sp. (strain PCC 7425 / ATCC 29141) TaxID=395961 RepID=B8HW31_CYAP4
MFKSNVIKALLSRCQSKQRFCPALLGGAIILSGMNLTAGAMAQTAPTQTGSSVSPSSLDQINLNQVNFNQPFNLPQASQLMGGAAQAQVTSVSQLSDVRPTDWAFQALQSLVEKYGCIAGYPDGTFRGNRAATRFELAAALNACLDVISDRFVSKEDLNAVKKLQDEFAAELATLRGRVDGLEARAAKLEAQQFSTTTKLSADALVAFQYGRTDGRFNTFDPETSTFNRTSGELNPTVVSVVQLNLNTSFTGEDVLLTTIAAGNNGADAIGALGVGASGFINAGSVDYSFYPNTVYLYRLAYTFKPTEDLALTFGPQFYPSDYVDANSYANDSFQDFSSGFFINNRLIVVFPVDGPGGAGAAFNWNPNGGPISVRGTYVAANAFSPVKDAFGGGFLGDPYQGTVEVEYANKFGKEGKNNFAVRLQYTNSATFDVAQNAGGLNVEASFGQFGLFGRYGYSGGQVYGSGAFTLAPFVNPDDFPAGKINFTAQTWMAGVGVRDLLREGSLLAAAVGQPFINDLPSSRGNNDATQTNYEAFFRFPVNDNITVTPVIMAITKANNDSTNAAIIQGVLRTTFSF